MILDQLDADPHPLLARLRASGPVAWVAELDGWLVTSRAAALAVLRDPATFTVDDPRFTTAQVIGPSMLSLDGPEHTRQRDPFARPFRPAQTRQRFTTLVETTVDDLVRGLAPRGAAELRAEFAGPLAVAVTAAALGLDGVSADTVRSWYGEFVTAISDLTAGRPATPTRAYEELRAHVAAATGLPGGALTLPEITANTAVLMFGGIDTTEGMIINAVLHLLSLPEPIDPGLLPGAVEESLRFEPAAAVVDRYATRDVELAGARVGTGDLVRVSITGANRDPAVFADPDRFDPRRPNAADHLAFAHGPHFCFGAHLARLETLTALRALLGRLPGLRLDPDRPAAVEGLVFRKPPALHALWDAPKSG